MYWKLQNKHPFQKRFYKMGRSVSATTIIFFFLFLYRNVYLYSHFSSLLSNYFSIVMKIGQITKCIWVKLFMKSGSVELKGRKRQILISSFRLTIKNEFECISGQWTPKVSIQFEWKLFKWSHVVLRCFISRFGKYAGQEMRGWELVEMVWVCL